MAFQPVILATGFEPFMGMNINSSWEAVRQLPDELLGCRVIKRELPVEWYACVNLLRQYMEEFRPHAVLATGQGHSVPPLLIERLGMNICSGPDNTHEIDMHEKPVFHNGPAAYFATYPYQAMHSRLKQEGIPVRYSFNAGQNQCNCILYSALHFAAQFLPGTVAGFLHVPMLPDEGVEGMTLEQSARAVRCCAEEIAKFLRPPMRTREEYRESL